MTTFVLVHGAWHGGWVWEQVAPRLERAGHRVVAPDLPCDDPGAGTRDYARTVIEALPEDGDVVLVAHSLGGLTAPLVPAQRPVGRLVLIAALPAQPGQSLVDQLRADRGILLHRQGDGLETDERRRTRWTDAETAARHMYTRAHPLVAAAAFARLRPQAAEPQTEPSPLERWPDVPTDYVVCTGDRMVSPAWGAGRARELGATVRELATDHSPMLSRPDDLAALLLDG